MANQLSKAEVFYIEQNPNGLTVEELAKELGRTKNTVKKIVDSVKSVRDTKSNEVVVDKVDTPKGTQIDNQFAKRERNGVVVATVMTEAAAGLADTTRPERQVRMKDAISKAIHPCRRKSTK